MKQATSAIPIVFAASNDPLGSGLVASLARPGGNLTEVVTLSGELGSNKLELLHEMIPAATVVALLVNPTNPAAETDTRKTQEGAHVLGLQLHVLHACGQRRTPSAGRLCK